MAIETFMQDRYGLNKRESEVWLNHHTAGKSLFVEGDSMMMSGIMEFGLSVNILIKMGFYCLRFYTELLTGVTDMEH